MAFQLRYCNVDPNYAPNTTDRIPQSGVNLDYVIARDKTGNVLSLFKDDSWDCRIYGAKHVLIFNSWWDEKARGPMDELARTLTSEMKLICWLSLFETTANSEHSRGFSHLHQLLVALRAIVRIAHSLSIPLVCAHNSKQFQVALRSSILNLDKGLTDPRILIALLKDAAFWQGLKNIECDVARLVSEDELPDVLALLYKRYNEKKDEREQHPLIPTRLFSRINSCAIAQLKAAEPHLPHLEAFIKAVQADPCLCADGRTDYSNNLRRVMRLFPDQKFPKWSEIKGQCFSTTDTLERFELLTYANQVGIKSIRSIHSHITNLQILCTFLIHAFSGMRQSEVQVMPFEPTVHSTAKGFGDLPLLVSHLKKFAQRGNYSRPLVWATSKEGVYAVSIAQQLTRLKWFRQYPCEDTLPNNSPLFSGDVDNVTAPHAYYSLPIASLIFSTPLWRDTCQSLGLVIEVEDLEELRTFDAFRTWDENPDFAVGKIWPLTSHQFRRSVAVYASRSGMVSLPTIKTQFKHLSEVMTALYSENSTFAQNFLIDVAGKPLDDSSVMMSFRDAVAFNTSLRFHEQVIKSESKLKGAIGGQIQRGRDSNSLPKIFQSREATQIAVKQGRFSFKETPVGGCVLKGSCPHFAIDLVLPCTSGCEHAILKPEKLGTYIESLRFDLTTLSPKSRPYQLIAKEINFIESTYLKPAETD